MTPHPPHLVHEHPSGLAPVVERNIQALLERRRRAERARSLQQRVASRISRFAGSMTFVYIHLVIFGLWILINVGWLPLLPRFDPSLVALAMVASVEAIFISTFVLITQNRMAELADERADLDLQISLLSEHEITRVLALVAEIAHTLGIDSARDPELPELKQDIAPEKVLDKIEQHQEKLESELAG